MFRQAVVFFFFYLFFVIIGILLFSRVVSVSTVEEKEKEVTAGAGRR